MEMIFVAALLGLSLIPLVKLGRSGALSAWLSVVLLAASGVLLGSLYRDQQAESLERAQYFEVEAPDIHREDGYVGSDSCRACHADEHASWHASYHRSMTQLATPESVQADFSPQTLESRGRRYRVEQRGDEYWVEMIDPDWEWSVTKGRRGALPANRKPVRDWFRVTLVTGSHDTQVYWLPGRSTKRLNFFPFVWKIESARWIPLADAFLKDPQSDEHLTLWNYSCLECHTTAPRSRPSADSGSNMIDMSTAVAELGIACEACHGPGEAHVEANRNPLQRYERRREGGDPTIVNPARLSHERSSQVCGQCHGMAWLKRSKVDIWKNGYAFRPGDDLADSKLMLDPLDPKQAPGFRAAQKHDPPYIRNRFWRDGMVRVSGRDYSSMRRSACYQEGELSCLSCHSMHDAAPEDQLSGGVAGSDQACMSCHAEIAADVAAHTHHGIDSSGSSCVACHMPRVTYGLLKGIRNHEIASPSIAETLDTGRPNACSLCHLDQSLSWTQDALVNWYGQERRALDTPQKNLAAGALLGISGDAGVRALIADAMGQPETRAVAGEEWMTPLLAQLMTDPYGAVRYIAERSLRRRETWAKVNYDPLAAPELRRKQVELILDRWSQGSRDRRGAAFLQDARGGLDLVALRRLLSRRDRTPLELGE